MRGNKCLFLRLTWPLTGASGSRDGCGQPSLNSGCAKTSPRSHGHCLAAADFWSMAFISALEQTQVRGGGGGGQFPQLTEHLWVPAIV